MPNDDMLQLICSFMRLACPMTQKNRDGKTLEELCRLASFEMDSNELNLLIEQIDRKLDEQHKAQRLQRPAQP